MDTARLLGALFGVSYFFPTLVNFADNATEAGRSADAERECDRPWVWRNYLSSFGFAHKSVLLRNTRC